MKPVVNLPVPSRARAPLSPAPVHSDKTARPEAAPALNQLRERLFLKAATAYAETQTLSFRASRSLDIYL